VTKRERAEIVKAIEDFYADDRWLEAMERLYNLIGIEYPLTRILKNAKTVTIQEIVRGSWND
jgi:hypothetical protein